jgi:hypothetical protein
VCLKAVRRGAQLLFYQEQQDSNRGTHHSVFQNLDLFQSQVPAFKIAPRIVTSTNSDASHSLEVLVLWHIFFYIQMNKFMYLSEVTVVWLVVALRVREVSTSVLHPDLIPRVSHGFPQHFTAKYCTVF